MSKNNTNIKDVETDIQSKSRHFLLNQNHDQYPFIYKKQREQIRKTNKIRTLEESQTRIRRLVRINGGNNGKE